jgi:hypothetical protein
VAATIGRLPFEQHLRACTSAKTLKGSDDYDAIAPALERYEKHVAEVTRTLSDAARYYARSEHSRDQFKKGMELHQKISDDLADFETAHAAYGKALRAWYPTLGPLADEAELDQGGKLAKRAVAEARTLTHLMLADPREQAAIDRALAATTKAGEALATHGRADASAPHPRTVGRQLETYLEVATAVARVAPAGASERYQIGYAMAQLLDAEQRALAQLLGGDDDDAFGARLRPLAPLAKPKHAPR